MRDGVAAILASGVVSQVKSRDAVHHASASAGDRIAGGSTTVARSCPSTDASASARASIASAAPAIRTITCPSGVSSTASGSVVERRQRVAEAGAGDAQRPLRARHGKHLEGQLDENPESAEAAEQQVMQVEPG